MALTAQLPKLSTINEKEINRINEIKVNPSDISKMNYTVDKNVLETLKWCRRNFGNRGDGWDFTGTDKKVTITIWSARLLTMFEICKN